MLLALFNAAQDEDIRSKNASVFVVLLASLLDVHTLKMNT